MSIWNYNKSLGNIFIQIMESGAVLPNLNYRSLVA